MSGPGARANRLLAIVRLGRAVCERLLARFRPLAARALVGADASHAWVGVFCGHLGWVDLDPTNNALVDTHHITISWGRITPTFARLTVCSSAAGSMS